MMPDAERQCLATEPPTTQHRLGQNVESGAASVRFLWMSGGREIPQKATASGPSRRQWGEATSLTLLKRGMVIVLPTSVQVAKPQLLKFAIDSYVEPRWQRLERNRQCHSKATLHRCAWLLRTPSLRCNGVAQC
jgi:hypothetical protein